MSPKEALSEFWYFLRHYKAWWITPIILILLVIAILAATTDDPAVLPNIYRIR